MFSDYLSVSCDYGKELDSFINQLRYFENNTFQNEQEVEVEKIAPNREQERTDPKSTWRSPKTKKNETCAMCKSKLTSNKNLELFIENLEKNLINPKNFKKSST